MRTSSSFASDGFVLHSYPYKETSLILETFTRSHGRVAMVAKGAKRGSASKYALNAFQPLSLEWFGKADMKTLKAADHQRINPQIRGAALMAAFYVNELLLKLAAKDDAHEQLFERYSETICALAGLQTSSQLSREIEIVLRRFELKLLEELGYGLTLAREADSDAAIDAQAEYLYVVERGPVRLTSQQEVGAVEPVKLAGSTILALARGELSDALTLAQAKQLMRRVINHHLGDKSLHTRQLIREMK
ncbi:MAG: DNA repair protein RecO [Rhodocyclaceae bacterium]|nr:DNA repair protein RecO [Rhodocyclaceae bacterium]